MVEVEAEAEGGTRREGWWEAVAMERVDSEGCGVRAFAAGVRVDALRLSGALGGVKMSV
jgi:hypothetical protein